MKDLGTRWRSFASVVADPWNLLLLVAACALFFLSRGDVSELAKSLLVVLVSLASGILGARISRQLSKMAEEGVLQARGRSAVRGLKLLLRNIATLEKRVRKFVAANSEEEQSWSVVRRNYEEAIEICSLLQEETVSSIENWTDIVPEADIRTQIGVISELRDSLREREDELGGLKKRLADTKGQSEKERKELKEAIAKRERQMADLNRKLAQTKWDALGSFTTLPSSLDIGDGGALMRALSNANIPNPESDVMRSLSDVFGNPSGEGREDD